jgi:hypothetical protein
MDYDQVERTLEMVRERRVSNGAVPCVKGCFFPFAAPRTGRVRFDLGAGPSMWRPQRLRPSLRK